MRKLFTLCGLAAVTLGAASALADTQATATMTSGPGSYYPYRYRVTLQNTGDTPISTFWFAWDDSGLNFMTQYPYLITDAGSWADLPTYNYYNNDNSTGWGIEWYTMTSPLQPGNSLSGFSFESYESPSEMGDISPVPPLLQDDPPFLTGTSFVYMGFPAQQDPGYQFVVTLQAPPPVPEPAGLTLLGCGIAGVLLRRRRV